MPFLPHASAVQNVDLLDNLDESDKQTIKDLFQRIRSKELFTHLETSKQLSQQLNNLFLSQCYNCHRWTIWVHDRVVYPQNTLGAMPNPDLPDEVRGVVEEARHILEPSPKGAAALLRLSIQMLCKELGLAGKDLNNDIGTLVKQGLNPIVQKSLDVVRVIGNEAVHPGVITLDDDKDTAIQLFDLVNIICEQMITQPQQVQALYEKLPKNKRKAIENRDS